MEIVTFDVLKNPEIIEEIGVKSFNNFYSKEKILERLSTQHYWANIARENGINLGFQISYIANNSETYFWLLGVIPESRKKGIASRLIDLQCSSSEEHGHKEITLKIHLGHPEAIRLYEKKGFKHFHTEKDYWGVGKDALYFKKFLPQ